MESSPDRRIAQSCSAFSTRWHVARDASSHVRNYAASSPTMAATPTTTRSNRMCIISANDLETPASGSNRFEVWDIVFTNKLDGSK